MLHKHLLFVRCLLCFCAYIMIASDKSDLSASEKNVPPLISVIRKGLPNVLTKMKKGKPVTIAYFGGSITAANGWRSKTFDWFKKTFPKAKLKQIHAAIGGTGSQLGVFRMDRDVLPHKPDLVFVEFAVNDGDGPFDEVVNTMEGIVRKIKKKNIETDICFIYTIHKRHFSDYDAKKSPITVNAMETVAEHYGIPSINVGFKAYKLVRAKKLGFPGITKGKKLPTFSKDACHPNGHGHQIYTDLINDVISKMPSANKVLPYALPAPLSKNNYENAKMIAPSQALSLSRGWKRVTKHKYGNRFDEFWTGSDGDTATIKFKGSGFLVYDVIGPDTGQFEVIIDGKAAKNIVRFDKYCTYSRLHWSEVATGLDPTKEHTITIKILKAPPVAPRNSKMKSRGTKINIGAILLNGELLPF